MEDMQVFLDATLNQKLSCQDTSVFVYVSSILPDFLPHLIRFFCGGASSNPSSQVTFKTVPNVCSAAASSFWALELTFPPAMTTSFTKLGFVKGGHGGDSERRPRLL